MVRQNWQRRSCLVAAFAIAAVLTHSTAWSYSPRTLMVPTGAAAGDNLGVSVSDAGDVNGDGYADVIVGEPNNDTAASNAGRAYVYYGGRGADAVADVTLTGAAPNGQFGISVSGAGDVNGDGYADVIVGESGYASGTGRAYVYYGGPEVDAVADLTLTGAATGDQFGISVSGAGEMVGGGYAGVIVGAHRNDAGGADAGRAYVYLGGPGGPDAVADLTLTGEAASDLFGVSVSGAGDVNRDGYADVIVGAQGNDAGGFNAGRAYVYYGGLGADEVADLTLTGAAAGDDFGISVSGAGDVNGDDYADVIVGADLNDAGGAEAGRAYVYYGGRVSDAVVDLTLTGAAAVNFFGHSVSGAGDVNGDGCADVIVGAAQNDVGGVDAGRAYVYYGGPWADAIADLILTGEATGDLFGASVSGAGDVNGDRYADVIVGAYQNDTAGLDVGRAYVVTSRPYEVLSPNGGEKWVAGQEQRVRWLGADPADLWISPDGGATWSTLAVGVGGFADNSFVLTAPGPATNLGKVRVSASGEPVAHASSDASDGVFTILVKHDPPAAAHRLGLTPTGAAANDGFGSSVSGAGDVNGDGYADVIVGATQNDAGGADAGGAYVYYGGPGADGINDLTLTGTVANGQFGFSVDGAGDVNRDGYGDVIVGAPSGILERMYLYYGGPGADATPDLTVTGVEAFQSFGHSVSGAGDVNHDGYDDVIVGAPQNDSGVTDRGRAFVYYGGAVANAVADVTLQGDEAFDFFGYSVSDAGDVNGDGYSDVIVGAPYSDAGGADAGRAYVYYGGAGPFPVADLTLTGAAAGDNFGAAVSGAGDVNGDGYADVIVGAYPNDGGSADAGRAYVYYGGPGMDAAADLTLTGAAAGDNFGCSVSGAGDVNGDGYGDVIVGANLNDALGTNAGRAYVYYGGPGADVVADVTLTGAAANDGFGNSVSGAGDVNGDGCADVIGGAPYNDAGGQNAGRVYLYEFNRYFLTAPNGGETWNVGAMKTISWAGTEPADVWLSVDGGNTHQIVESRVGGSEVNTLSIRVPHTPTKFARIKVTPSDAAVVGFDRSDSLFTIQTSVQLLSMLAAALAEGGKGAMISWATDPGPEDLAGYKLEKAEASRSDPDAWRTVVALTRETAYMDPSGGPGSRYRLFAVNGFGEELWLGEASLRPLKPLAAWPLPYRSGMLNISFATSGLGGGGARTELLLFDVSGRLVRRLDSGVYESGYRTVTWDGRDVHGRRVAAGLYFLRTRSELGYERAIKVAVLP
jgi:hypothetical protein